MNNQTILLIAASGILGIILGWLITKIRKSATIHALQQTLQQKEELFTALETTSKQIQQDKEDLLTKLAIAQTKLAAAETAKEEALSNNHKISEQLKLEIEALADRVMKANSHEMAQKNEAKIGEILKPLQTELGEFKKKVEETYDKESKERFSLGKEIERLVSMSEQVSVEANNLTTALKGNVKMQGNWGEMILETILEHSGLTKGREYVTQEFIRDNTGNVVKDEQGHGLQPDVIISYPDARKVIIDSKVTLLAWDQYVQEQPGAEKEKALQAHIQSIKLHIDGLSKKNYPKYAEALDYVLLFVPIEPAFLEAVKGETKLWKYAYDKKIMLVSPTNLLAVLKIIADLWKVEQQNKNAIHIAEKAGALYDKFCGLLVNIEQVGKKIKDANDSYEEAYKQLHTGKGNLIGRVEELKKMGAAAQKQLPERLLGEELMDPEEKL